MKKSILTFLFLFVCEIISCPAQKINRRIDSLKNVLLTLNEDSNKVITLNYLCREYFKAGDYDRAIENVQIGMTLARKIGYKSGLGKMHIGLGLINKERGNLPAALKEYFEALRIQEERKDKRMIAWCYRSIGGIYADQGNHPDALKNLKSSLQMTEVTLGRDESAEAYNLIGNVYYDMENYPEALKNFFTCLKISGETGKQQAIAASYANIGNVYFAQRNFSAAFEKHFQALKIFEKIRDKSLMATSYNCIGNIYISTGNVSEARKWLEKALRLGKELQIIEVLKYSYEFLASADNALGNYKSALENYRLYITYRDSLINEENTKKTVQLQMQYEFDKREAATKADQEKKDASAKAEQDKKDAVTKIVIYSMSSGLMLVLALAGLIFVGYRQKRKANITITRQKAEVEKQKALVEEKQKDILDSIHYAKRIQRSLLPTEMYIARQLQRMI